MSRRAGVDLSSTRAVLASVSQTRRSVQLRGFAFVEAEGAVDVIAADLREARRTYRFPRAAEVVAWPNDARAAAVEQAGFRVERVITPGEALARVARLHYREGPGGVMAGVIAVVSLQLDSGAVAIVRDGHLLFETRLAWSVAATLSGAESELLQRYTFISELTESLRRIFETVRSTHRVNVTEILTCGSLPELRSLTMPLAAEFDVEVETLDLTDDIQVRVPDASPQQMRDTIASLRLAIAAGKRWHKRTAAEMVRGLGIPRLTLATRAALAAAACVLLVFAWVRFGRPVAPQVSSAARVPVSTRPATRAGARPEAPARLAPARVAPPPLVAKPIRVNARLARPPKGIEHAALVLALAQAEQSIAPPRETTRQAAAPTAPAPVVAQKSPPRAVTPTVAPAAVVAQKSSPGAATPTSAPSAAIAQKSSPPAPAITPNSTPRAAAPTTASTPTRSAPSAGRAPEPARIAKADPAVPVPKTASAVKPNIASAPPANALAATPKPEPARGAVVQGPPPVAPRRRAAEPAAPALSASTTVVTPSPERRIQPTVPAARQEPRPAIADAAADARVPAKPARSYLPAPADVIVSSILWSSDRQLAIVNSRIVGAGDVIGTQTVVQIEADAVVFRDRAGRLRRAGLK